MFLCQTTHNLKCESAENVATVTTFRKGILPLSLNMILKLLHVAYDGSIYDGCACVFDMYHLYEPFSIQSCLETVNDTVSRYLLVRNNFLDDTIFFHEHKRG